jgi:hypothetical protein
MRSSTTLVHGGRGGNEGENFKSIAGGFTGSDAIIPFGGVTISVYAMLNSLYAACKDL